MDILATKISSTENKPGSSSFVLQNTVKLISSLIKFFVITDKELSESGIMIGNDNQEDTS